METSLHLLQAIVYSRQHMVIFCTKMTIRLCHPLSHHKGQIPLHHILFWPQQLQTVWSWRTNMYGHLWHSQHGSKSRALLQNYLHAPPCGHQLRLHQSPFPRELLHTPQIPRLRSVIAFWGSMRHFWSSHLSGISAGQWHFNAIGHAQGRRQRWLLTSSGSQVKWLTRLWCLFLSWHYHATSQGMPFECYLELPLKMNSGGCLMQI